MGETKAVSVTYGALVPPSLVDDLPARESYLADLATRAGFRLTGPVRGEVIEPVSAFEGVPFDAEAGPVGRIWALAEPLECQHEEQHGHWHDVPGVTGPASAARWCDGPSVGP